MSQVQILNKSTIITVQQNSDQIIEVVNQNLIIAIEGDPMINIYIDLVPFSIIAGSDGQSAFVLPETPVAVTMLVVRGVVQDQAASPPDFTLSGDTITLNGTIDTGEVVYGIYQKV